MILPSATIAGVSKLDQEIYFEVFKIIIRINDGIRREKFDLTYRCHSINRALYAFLGPDLVTVQDGFFIGIIWNREDQKNLRVEFSQLEHTWLRCRESGAIVDPYPSSMFTITPIMSVPTNECTPFLQNKYVDSPNSITLISMKEIVKETRSLIRYLKTKGMKQQACPFTTTTIQT